MQEEQKEEHFGLHIHHGESFEIKHDDSCDHSIGSTIKSWLPNWTASSHATNSSQHMYNHVAQWSVLEMANGNEIDVQGRGSIDS